MHSASIWILGEEERNVYNSQGDVRREKTERARGGGGGGGGGGFEKW